jgi:hypothetical protein
VGWWSQFCSLLLTVAGSDDDGVRTPDMAQKLVQGHRWGLVL